MRVRVKSSWVNGRRLLLPKENGGLEVRRLEEKGINLLLFMKKKLGNGLSTLFWDDVWCDGGKLKNIFLDRMRTKYSNKLTVGQKLAHPSLYQSIRRHPRGSCNSLS
ncbi:hypothetical protein Tco_0025853 [Tanacetum coccineum]